MITVVLVTSSTCTYCPAIKKIVNELKPNYEDCDVGFTTIELGSEGENMDFAREWEVRGVPTVIIINRKPNESAFEQARLVGTEDITEEKLIYCIESFRTKDEKKTHEEYERELFEQEIDYFPLEPYIDCKTPILHECLKEHKWKARPRDILYGYGCPHCAKNIRKTKSEYEKELKSKDISYTPIEPYQGATVKIKHQCLQGHVWSAMPHSILRGTGCPVCNKKGKYNDTYFLRYPEIADEPGILYCVVLENKHTFEREVIKIGITKGKSYKDVNKRARQFSGYNVKIQKIVKGTLKQVYELEQRLHKQWEHKRLNPELIFGGYTECFEPDNAIIKSIPTSI